MTNTIDQFNLKWGMHYPNFIECFTEHRTTGELVDVTLMCGGRRLGAHRLILAACSGYFQTLFREAQVGLHSPISALLHPIVVLPGKYEHLKAVVDFIYRGEVQVLDSDLKGVLELGELLQVKGLSSVKLQGPSAAGGEQQAVRTVRRRRRSLEETKPPVVVVNDDDTLDSFTSLDSRSSVNGRLLGQEQQQQQLDGEPCAKRANKPKILKTYGKPIKSQENNATPTIPPKEELPEEKRPVPGIPQVVNPFMLFANGFRNKVSADHPEENSKQISIRLSQMWNTLSAEVKEPYYETARKAQKEHEEREKGGGESEGELKIDESVDSGN